MFCIQGRAQTFSAREAPTFKLPMAHLRRFDFVSIDLHRDALIRDRFSDILGRYLATAGRSRSQSSAAAPTAAQQTPAAEDSRSSTTPSAIATAPRRG
jgi:hypothetical protein